MLRSTKYAPGLSMMRLASSLVGITNVASPGRGEYESPGRGAPGKLASHAPIAMIEPSFWL
ncbi:MAG TPA: hypothetical protein VLS25_11380 [Dehalococcoidia bacterium]|nr:hypothetical protein [Dehalococcoidia bacterium]